MESLNPKTADEWRREEEIRRFLRARMVGPHQPPRTDTTVRAGEPDRIRQRDHELETTSTIFRSDANVPADVRQGAGRRRRRRGPWPVARHRVGRPGGAAPATATLSGTEFDLHRRNADELHRRPKIALTVNGSLPAPTLRWREGDTVTLRVANTLRRGHASIHWHGILLPANMDGVPGLSFHGIRRRDVRLPLRRAQGGHVLVSQPLGLPGAARPVRSRSSSIRASRSRSSTTASTS